ncbi:MAG TPA: hypothetical protein VHC20_00220 [Candidatus Paceibacterota bacterium]|nr:hypothetical protein [Candidatus Paceibacterota bacterium]
MERAMSKSSVIALALQQVRDASPIGIFEGTEDWNEEEGVLYCNFDRQVRAAAPLVHQTTLLDGVEFECLQVENVRPHYHTRSGSVVQVIGGNKNFEGLFSLSNTNLWLPLHLGQTIILDPGVPHGFRRIPGTKGDPLLVAVGSLPPIAPDDTHYL